MVMIIHFTLLRNPLSVHFTSPRNPESRPFLCSGALRCRTFQVQVMIVNMEPHTVAMLSVRLGYSVHVP